MERDTQQDKGMSKPRARSCSYLWGGSFQGLSGEGGLRAGSESLDHGDK